MGDLGTGRLGVVGSQWPTLSGINEPSMSSDALKETEIAANAIVTVCSLFIVILVNKNGNSRCKRTPFLLACQDVRCK